MSESTRQFIQNIQCHGEDRLPRNAFVDRYRCIIRHSMHSYYVLTMFVVVRNSPRNCNVITGSLLNFHLRNVGLKVCGSVRYYIRVTRREIYFIN